MNFRKASALILTALCLLLLLNCCTVPTKSRSYQKSDIAMGSAVSVKLYALGDADTEQVAQQMITKIKQLDTLISKNDENAFLYSLNQKSGQTLETDPELIDYIIKTKEVYALSDSKLSVTSGALTELWGFDTDNFRLPEEAEIKKAIPFCSDEGLTVSKKNLTVFVPEGGIINLGSVGKGIACDKAVECFNYSSQSCQGAVISVGGSIAVIGSHDKKQDWTVGIRNPFGEVNDYFGTLTVSGTGFVSTSGSYEKSFNLDGKSYHHILDLTTGYPVETELVSVSVKADSGLFSDALSTMCFVLGEEKSKDILNRYNAQAVFVYKDKSVSVTDGIKDAFKIVNGEFKPI